jgi:hypothetical protein
VELMAELGTVVQRLTSERVHLLSLTDPARVGRPPRPAGADG